MQNIESEKKTDGVMFVFCFFPGALEKCLTKIHWNYRFTFNQYQDQPSDILHTIEPAQFSGCMEAEFFP